MSQYVISKPNQDARLHLPSLVIGFSDVFPSSSFWGLCGKARQERHRHLKKRRKQKRNGRSGGLICGISLCIIHGPCDMSLSEIWPESLSQPPSFNAKPNVYGSAVFVCRCLPPNDQGLDAKQSETRSPTVSHRFFGANLINSLLSSGIPQDLYFPAV